MTSQQSQPKINDRTRDFNNKVQQLINDGKTNEEVIEALKWDKSPYSLVRNNKRNIPDEKYDLFNAVFSFENTDISEDRKNITALIESNRLLAEAHKIFAEANLKLSVTTERLSRLSGVAIAPDPSETYEAFLSMISNLQQVVLDLAVGRRFENKNEVASLLYNTGRAAPVRTDVADISANSGK